MEEGCRENGEFRFEGWKLEFRFVVELGCVEEDEERERARTREGEDAAEEVVGEAEDAVGCGGLEVLELGDEVVGGC